MRCNETPDLSSGEVERAYSTALRFLAYRPRSHQEVRKRLARRFPAHAVQQALERLKERNYLDDAAFARFWRESREAHQPRSAAFIRRELEQRGVVRELAEDAVAGLDDDDSAYRAGHRRLRALQGLDEVTFHRRLGDYLRRRGFSFGVVRTTLKLLWEEREG
ncbi:MAG: regulatory protein RecX [Dehalococcoidia bacterium]